MSLVWYNDHRTFVRIFFFKLWQKEYFQESSTYIKPSRYDKIYVPIVMKLCQISVNDPIIIILYRNEFCETYILLNGHET